MITSTWVVQEKNPGLEGEAEAHQADGAQGIPHGAEPLQNGGGMEAAAAKHSLDGLPSCHPGVCLKGFLDRLLRKNPLSSTWF